MAENTTTYKAIIETEVKGTKDIDEMNKKIEDGEGKFKSLKTQIRETTVKLQELEDQGKVNTKEFKDLADQLDDLGDKQKKVAFQSGQIEDKLSALPGPLGSVGKGFASMKDAVDTFGVRLAIATGGITLIIGAVIAMKDAMSKTAEGQETLNKVSQAFSSILAPIFAVLEKVGIPLFNKFAQILTSVGNGISWVVEKLGISSGKVKEIYGNIDEVSKKSAEAEKTRQEELTKKNKEEQDKRKVAHEKYLKDKEDREREAAEAEKRGLQDQLDQYEKHLKARKKLDDSYISGDSLKSRTADAKKEEDDKIKRAAATAETIRLLGINSIEKQSAFAVKNTQTTLTKEYDAKNKAVNKENKLLTWLNSEKKKKLDENLMAVKAGLNLAGNLVDEGSNAAKAISIAQTTIDTYQSATAAYKSVVGIPVVGPVLAVIAAGAAVTAGIMSVNKILSTKVPKMGDGSVGEVSGGSGIEAPTAPTIPSMQFNDSSMNVGGNNPNTQLVGTLAQATNRPIKAFVVSQDMSSTQALDRRTNRAATF